MFTVYFHDPVLPELSDAYFEYTIVKLCSITFIDSGKLAFVFGLFFIFFGCHSIFVDSFLCNFGLCTYETIRNLEMLMLVCLPRHKRGQLLMEFNSCLISVEC